jgi:hypothetical protein
MKTILLLISLLAINFYASAQKNISLTAIYEKDKKAIVVQWQHVNKHAISYTLQSSKDTTFFSDIVTKLNSGNFIGSTFEYIDKTITGEKIYYRLRVNLNDAMVETTLPVTVVLNNTKNTWLIYPLPAKEIINLKYIGNGTVDGVISIFILRISSGTIFTRLRLASNTKNIIIPITNLGSGVYNIQVAIGNRPVWNQQFIKY